MVSLRGAVPLLLTGTSGIALVAFGIGGLSGMDPQIQQAAETVKIEQSAPGHHHQYADCPPEQDRSRAAGEV